MSKKKAKEETGDFVVLMRCVVTKAVCVSGCNKEQAEDDPWKYAGQADELEMTDWRVLSVEPND